MMNKIRNYIKENQLNLYQIAIQDGNGIRCERCQPCNDCNNIYSVAKVFLNTAIGVLIDEKKLKLDDTILPFLQPYIDFSYADVWNNVTVQHALSHRMGVDEGVIDIDRDDIRTYGTDNHLKYILDYPPKFRLGSYRKYTDCGHYLLSLVIEQITGMPADDFIRESILCRLDFQHTAWTRCPLNHTVGATGAYMRAADMVKLGWMYVNNGKYDDKHILSEGWTRQMEKEKFDFYPVKGSSFFRKGGMNGQMLLYSREKNISIAWMGFEDDKKIQQFADFIVGQI